jgi:hypothetical protein
MRRLITALLAVPVVGWLGCSLLIGLDEGHAGDLCKWLEHPESNCVTQFHESPAALMCGSTEGAFPPGAQLAACELNGGGSIVFEPSIDPAAWSPDQPRQIKFLSGEGAECGSFTYKELFSFSVTVNPGADAGATTMLTVDHDVASNDMNVSCPGTSTSSETRHFNLDQVSGNGCAKLADDVPEAIFRLIPSSAYHPGLLHLEVHFPASKMKPSGAITYVDCTFPQVACVADGIKNGNEADVDCGGPERMPGCPKRCEEAQLCNADCDCDAFSLCKNVGGILKCVTDPMTPMPDKGVCGGIICSNGTKDDSESDKDCGGVCGGCADGKACVYNEDCVSNSCVSDICVPSNCMDFSTNGAETGIDCGGGTCPKCVDGQTCAGASDCMSGGCTASGVCSQCADTMKDGAETDLDCGGGKCDGCAEGQICKQDSDCATNVCTGGKCNGCGNGQQDGKETDLDCGGPFCPNCVDGKDCMVGTDCVSDGCLNGLCSPCANGLQDNAETDIDCGGGTCPKCDNGRVCVSAADCTSALCSGNKCGSCSDGFKDGDESDVDCGGTVCIKCGEGKMCNLHFDCAFGYCDVGIPPSSSGGSVMPGICNTCEDGFTDGNESDKDCGGPTCKKCLKDDICKVNADCTTGLCINKLCK